MPERITNSAIRYGSMVVTPSSLGRHHHVFQAMAASCIPLHQIVGQETQGFVTDRGRFVDRKEALKIARRAGQIKKKHGSPGDDDLYSEDLW